MGELKLVAASNKVKKESNKESVVVGNFNVCGQEVKLYAHKHVDLPVTKDGEANDKPWLSHFWLVQQSNDDFNMELTWVEEEVGIYKVYVPMLQNQRALKQGDVLARRRHEEEGGPMPKTQKTCILSAGGMLYGIRMKHSEACNFSCVLQIACPNIKKRGPSC